MCVCVTQKWGTSLLSRWGQHGVGKNSTNKKLRDLEAEESQPLGLSRNSTGACGFPWAREVSEGG